MTQEEINCPSCHTIFVVRRHKKARWALAGVGAVIGGAATESLLGGVVFGAITYGAARAYDEHRAHQCPECQTVTFPARFATEQVSAPEPATVHH